MAEQVEDKQVKQEQLKAIIRQLHEGKTADEVKSQFEKYIKNVSPEEIATVENALINEGLPVEEVQRLCDVHARVFDSALARYKNTKKMPGHPVYTFMEENKALRKILSELKRMVKRTQVKGKEEKETLTHKLGALKLVDLHYQRKENQLFPFLEKSSFTGPSKVMWGKHNEIREKLKSFEKSIFDEDWKNVQKTFNALSQALSNMIFLEEKILFPTSLRKLTDEQWIEIKEGEPDIGYAWIKPGNLWDAALARKKLKERNTVTSPSVKPAPAQANTNGIPLDTGALSRDQINLMLKNLPVDVSFVDENDHVLYYSQNKERIFPRSPGVIGRSVQNCHPQKSVETVNRIIESFKKKQKSEAEFWISLAGKFVLIRYFALYDDAGNYKGVLEVSQDATGIRKLEGEKRLLDWK
jgi:uncharacterized protein